MKGIAHFASGVAAASFCPWAVRAAMEGNPLYFILGGAFGILPDTLDFKFYRFFYPHDVYIEPDPQSLDAQAIADQIANTVGQAAATRQTQRLKLSTIRMGADAWQQYTVKFDGTAQEVIVDFGPVVNTGQVPIPGFATPEKKTGRAKLPAPIVQTYDSVTHIDIFDGPSFAFEPQSDGRVELQFLPWHRSWTHSFTLAVLFAVIGWLVWDWRAAVVILLGMSAHILEDQLGLMGSNLLYPITKKRIPGLYLMRSGDVLPNFGTVWACGLLIFWNLYRFLPNPTYRITFPKLLLYGAIIPLGIYWVAYTLVRERAAAKTEPTREAGDEFDNPVSAA